MKLCKNVLNLEQKFLRIEKLIWYVAGVMTLKFGGEAIPTVMAMIK